MTEASAQGEANQVRNKYCLLYGLAMIHSSGRGPARCADGICSNCFGCRRLSAALRAMSLDPRTGGMAGNVLLAFAPGE